MTEENTFSRWVCFRMDKETCALRVDDVREVTTYIAPVPVPGSPETIEGILNIRGNIVTVASGRKLLSKPDTHDLQTSQVALLELHQGALGLIIDEVGGLISLDESTIERDLNHENPDLIIGTVQHEGRLVLLMSLHTYCEGLASHAYNSTRSSQRV